MEALHARKAKKHHASKASSSSSSAGGGSRAPRRSKVKHGVRSGPPRAHSGSRYPPSRKGGLQKEKQRLKKLPTNAERYEGGGETGGITAEQKAEANRALLEDTVYRDAAAHFRFRSEKEWDIDADNTSLFSKPVDCLKLGRLLSTLAVSTRLQLEPTLLGVDGVRPSGWAGAEVSQDERALVQEPSHIQDRAQPPPKHPEPAQQPQTQPQPQPQKQPQPQLQQTAPQPDSTAQPQQPQQPRSREGQEAVLEDLLALGWSTSEQTAKETPVVAAPAESEQKEAASGDLEAWLDSVL